MRERENKLHWGRGESRFILLGLFIVFVGSFSSKNLLRFSFSTNNHGLLTDGDGAVGNPALCEVTESSPLAILEFGNRF